MRSVDAIQLPLRHVGSVNAWLLRGDPLTLVDAGPRNDEALAALEQGLREHGVRLEDIELLIGTHHHLDHVGLFATLQRRSGAQVAVLDALADYGSKYEERAAGERAFSRALMAAHGVPDQVIADNEGFWDYIGENSESFGTDIRLVEGDVIRAGERDLRVVLRPGHSTTDTLLMDEATGIAFVGDHVLAGISSNTEIYPGPGEERLRPRARANYIEGLRKTAAMPLQTLLTGHGAPVKRHKDLIQRRLVEHNRRSERIAAALEAGPRSAYGVAHELWPARMVREQPLLVLWEVLGHLDLLLSTGLLEEQRSNDGHSQFALHDVAA
jgi:glyoxylase-like metal-dependent hydrolase (beta-lactamase superfamily II)